MAYILHFALSGKLASWATLRDKEQEAWFRSAGGDEDPGNLDARLIKGLKGIKADVFQFDSTWGGWGVSERGKALLEAICKEDVALAPISVETFKGEQLLGPYFAFKPKKHISALDLNGPAFSRSDFRSGDVNFHLLVVWRSIATGKQFPEPTSGRIDSTAASSHGADTCSARKSLSKNTISAN